MNASNRLFLRDDLINYAFIGICLVESFLLFFGLHWLVKNGMLNNGYSSQVQSLLALNLSLSWFLSVTLVSIFFPHNLNASVHYVRAVFTAGLIYGLGLILLLPLNKLTQITFNDAGRIFYLTYAGLLIIRGLFYLLYKINHKVFSKKRQAIIIGDTPGARKLIETFKQPGPLSRFVQGIFDDQLYGLNMKTYHLGNLEEVKNYCLQNKVDEIYYTLSNHKSYLEDLRNFCDHNFIYLGILPDLDQFHDFKVKTQIIDNHGIPLISYQRSPLSYQINRFSKRALDIAFSLVALAVMIPTIFPVIAIMIKLDSPGPVFFRQLRSGLNCKPFWCYKFRTMKVNQESDLRQATRNDNRVTWLGKFLRKSSLDELPQFWNVLIGDMSVVGPRPHMITHTETYSNIINNYKVRHHVDSGITGYAQVNGYRGETKDPALMEKRVKYDTWYLENWSLGLDLKIIFVTTRNLFKKDKNAV